MLKIGKIERVPFIFNNNKTSSNLFQGLKDHGPYDLRTREFKKLQIEVLVPTYRERVIRDFITNLTTGFERFFLIDDIDCNFHPFRRIEDIRFIVHLRSKKIDFCRVCMDLAPVFLCI